MYDGSTSVNSASDVDVSVERTPFLNTSREANKVGINASTPWTNTKYAIAILMKCIGGADEESLRLELGGVWVMHQNQRRDKTLI